MVAVGSAVELLAASLAESPSWGLAVTAPFSSAFALLASVAAESLLAASSLPASPLAFAVASDLATFAGGARRVEDGEDDLVDHEDQGHQRTRKHRKASIHGNVCPMRR